MDKQLVVSPAPHLKSPETIKSVMVDVLAALVPAAIAAVIFFGTPALLTMVITTLSAMLTEALTLRNKNILVTAVPLLPVCCWPCPAAGPRGGCVVGGSSNYWQTSFGGIGNNIFNPALVARAILMVSWAGHMTTWLAPLT